MEHGKVLARDFHMVERLVEGRKRKRKREREKVDSGSFHS